MNETELKCGTLVVTDQSELIMLNVSGVMAFAVGIDVREAYSGVIIQSHDAKRIGRPWQGTLVREVGHINHLIQRWQLATQIDLLTPAELPDSALTPIEVLQRENKRLADRLAKLEGAKA